LPFLLDTGASVSVLPKGKLSPLLPKPLCSYICSDTRDSRSITAIGGHTVTVEGPYVFPIEILTHKLMHKFYVIDAPSPFIAGYDLVAATHLIIDAAGRTVYTRNPASNTFVSASLDPISPPAADVAVISLSDPGDEPPPVPHPSDPATLEPSTPASALAAHEPSDALRHPVVAPLTPSSDDPSPSSTTVPAGVPPSDSDASDADVPEHLRMLYLSTLEEANLSLSLASNFRDLLVTHQHVLPGHRR